MKKILSLLLTLALILGCVSMVTIHAQEQEDESVRFTLDSVKGGNDYSYFFFYNVADGITVDGNTATLKVTIRNEGPIRIWPNLTVMISDPWTTITTVSGNSQEAVAGTDFVFTATFDASYLLNPNLGFYINFTTYAFEVGSSIVVSSNGKLCPVDSQTIGEKVGLSDCTGTVEIVSQRIPAGEEPTTTPNNTPTSLIKGAKITLDTAGDDKNYIHFYGAANGVTVNGDTATLEVNIFNNGPTRMWARVVPVIQEPWLVIANETAAVQEAIVGETTTYTVSFNANYLNDANFGFYIYYTTYQFTQGTSFDITTNANLAPGQGQTINDKIKFAGNCSGNISYIVDDSAVGVQLNVNAIPGENKVVHINSPLLFKNSMVNNGVLTFRTTIYNPNNHDIVIGAQLKNGWGELASCPNQDVVVLANTKRTVTLQVNLSEATDGKKENVSVRYNLISGYQAGDVLYFAADNTGIGFCDIVSWWVQESNNGVSTVTELPNLKETAVAGVKLDINTIPGENKVLHINNGLIFDESMIEDGVLTFTTSIYNPNNHDITIGVQLKNVWGELASNPHEEIIVSAKTKQTVTLSVDLSEATEGVKESVNVRYNLINGYVEGDVLYFTAEQSGVGFFDSATWWSQEATNVLTAVGIVPNLQESVPAGVKLNINTVPGTNNVVQLDNTLTFTDSMIEDGVLTFTTSIYNPNNHDITIGVQLKDGWNDLASNPNREIIVASGTKRTVTLKAKLSEATNDINLRYSLVDGYQEGDVIYFSAEEYGLGYLMISTWWLQEQTNTLSTVSELPNLAEVVTGAMKVEERIEYEITGETVTITGFNEKHVGDFVIPNTIEGKPVTAIKAEAFKDCKGLINLILSENLISVGENAFLGCDNLQNVYYIGAESQWNNIEFGSGNDILLTAEITFEYGTGDIIGADLELGSTLTINYFVESDVEVSNLTMRFRVSSGKVIYVLGAVDITTGYYKFAYNNINPQCMMDTITAELIISDKVLDTKADYGVKVYCDNQLARTKNELGFVTWAQYDAFKKLLADMLVYGSAAQEYMGYNTDILADTEAWVQDYKSSFTVPTGVKNITGNQDKNNCIKSASLSMSNVNKIYFRLILTNENVKVILNGEEVNKENLSLQSDGTYLLYTYGITATEFDKVFTLTLVDGDNEISKIEYNVNAYIQSKHQSASVGKIVQALSNYGKSAEEFWAALYDKSGDFEIGEEDSFA